MEEDNEEEEDNTEKLEKNVENENKSSEGSTYSEEENESEEDPMVDHALVLNCKMQPTLYVEVLKLCISPPLRRGQTTSNASHFRNNNEPQLIMEERFWVRNVVKINVFLHFSS